MIKKKVLVLGLTLLSPMLAIGQEEKKEQHDLSEVVVVATRIPEVKQNSASSISIITSKELQEISRFLPDMHSIIGYLVPGTAPASNLVNERTNTLRGRSVLVLIDGIPQSTPLRLSSRDLRSIDPAAVERVEIIKGATAIYGNGANGGIINIVTKKNAAHKSFGGETSLAVSDHALHNNTPNTHGYRVNQQLYGDLGKFTYLVNASLAQTGSSVDADGQYLSPRQGLGDTRAYNALVKLGYSFSDKTNLELMYNLYKSRQNSLLIASGGKYLESPRIGVRGEQPKEAIPEGVDYNHNAYLKLTSRDIFKYTNLEASLQARSLKVVYDYRTVDPQKNSRWEGKSGQATIVSDQVSLRSQFLSRIPISEKIASQFLYGVDFTIDRTSQPLVDGRYWVPEMTAYNPAVFLQSKISFANDLNFKGGLRYDHITVKVPTYNVLVNKSTDAPIRVTGKDLLYNNLSFNVGLSYNRYKAFQPFIAYSEGFAIYDLGRGAVRDAKTSDALNNIETEPVRTQNYEAGFYSNFKNFIGENTELELQGAAFYTYAALGSDLISRNGFWVVDRSPQKVYGFELSANATLSKKLQLGTAFTWFEGQKQENGSWDHYMSGLSIPPAKLTASLTYRPTKNTFLRMHLINTGSRDRFEMKAGKNGVRTYDEGEGKVEPVTLVNLNAGFNLGKMTYGIGVENLFNNNYYTVQSQFIARDAEYVRGNGRIVTLSGTYRF